MRNTLFLCFCLLFAFNISALGAIKAEITYIGNEGFMIKNNNKKVFIDALYYYTYGGGIINTDTLVRNRIMANKEQFSNADLFLITHNHPDHYDQPMMTKFLNGNPQAKLVAQADIVNGITKSTLAGQLVKIAPAKFHSTDTTINNIPVTVYNLIHDIGYRIPNVGYVANIDGLTIFHAGDNTFEDTLEYTGFNLKEKNIDVAFLNYNGYWKTARQREFIMKHIHPKYIVLMHIPTTGIETIKKTVGELPDSFVPVIVFSASMEKATVTDEGIMISNHMPVQAAVMKDTLINTNADVTIRLPELFKDNDTGDSLTYEVSGLPSGFKYDNQQRTISGVSPVEIKNKIISITARDRSLCSNSTSFKITVQKPTGVQSFKQRVVEIYPNPAFNQLNISSNPSIHAKIVVYDLQGKQVINKQVGNGPIDISSLTRGIYSVCLIDNDTFLWNKLVKQ